MNGRIPPQNLEAEKSVLGSCLLDPQAFEEIKDTITPEDFYKEAHRIIYRHMHKLDQALEPIDLVTMDQSLSSTREIEAVGNTSYLIGLADSVSTAAYIHSYANIVKTNAQHRSLIALAGQIMQQAYDSNQDPLTLISQAQTQLSELETTGQTKDFHNSHDLANRFMEALDERKENPNKNVIPTGFKSLDPLLAGFEKSKLYILAARPAMGKSALALAFAANAAKHSSSSVALFCLEMEADEMFSRLVTSESKVSNNRIKKPEHLASRDYATITNTLSMLSNQNIFINDDVTLSIDQMKAAARKLKNKKGLDLIIIDYTQLMRGVGGTRQEEVSNISRGLKIMARELDVPVLALSQLSRAVESRPDKRPMLSDLRDSGSIEQDADVVMFIYRDDYYLKERSEKQGIAEIIISKQRNGPTGTAELRFIDKHVRFEEPQRNEIQVPASAYKN